MSDITVRTIIKKYLLTQYAHEAGIILDIFAIE